MARAWVGTYERALDDKGRVVLPPVFRDRLKDDGGVLSREVDGCLALRTHDEFTAMVDQRLAELGPGAAARDFKRALSDQAQDVTPDSQGRITLPAELMAFGGLEPKGAVVVSGAVSHVELWNADRRRAVIDRASARLENPDQSGLVI